MTRNEIFRLRTLGLMTDEELLDELTLEVGDQVPAAWAGRPFREYLQHIIHEIGSSMHVPDQVYRPLEQGSFKICHDQAAAVITLQIRPPVTTQWINMGIQIKPTHDLHEIQKDNSPQGLDNSSAEAPQH